MRNCWPFLVSCNRRLDYRTIVAPDFICEIGDASILANAADGDLTGENEAFCREIHKSKAGELTLVFRVIETTFEEMGIEGSGVLKDSWGREIRLIEGIVIKGLLEGVIVTKDDLEKAHGKVVKAYREFWKCTNSKQPAQPSECFDLLQDSPQSCLQYQRQAPYGVEIVKSDRDETVEIPQTTVSTVVEPYIKSTKIQEWRSKETDNFDAEVTSAIFVLEGKGIAIRYEQEQTIIISNFETGKNTPFRHDKIPIWGCPTPIAISPNGKYMASGVIKILEENIVKLWSITDSKKAPKEMSGHQVGILGRILAVAFTQDNEILLSGGQDNTIFFWDVKSGGSRRDKIYFSSEIRAIAVSPKEYPPIFAIGDSRGRIEFCDWKSIKKIRSFQAHGSPNESPVNSLAFSPDGKILVSGGDDYKIKLWNVDGGEQLNIGNHSAIVTTVAFSPDGKLIASGDDSGMIKIWNIETMESVVLPKHYGAVTSVAFSPDGKTLASASKDKTVRLWERV